MYLHVVVLFTNMERSIFYFFDRSNMERSIMVEENHWKSKDNTVSKSDGLFIQIDLVSIHLVSVKDKSNAGKCEHFSIS